MSADVLNDTKCAVAEHRLLALIDFLYVRLEIDPAAALAVRLVDEIEMTRMHVEFMGLEGPTDVLSFPMDDGPDDRDPTGAWLIGDIAICPAVASVQAEAAGHDQQSELELLLTHGVLHLLGHDHEEPDDERIMFALQAELLAAWGAVAGVT